MWKVKVHIRDKLRTRSTFSQSVTVSVGISKLGLTGLIFVDPGVKINGGYYRDMLLSQQLLPVIHDVSGNFLNLSTRQRTCIGLSGTRHCAIFKQSMPAFIPPDLWPPNSIDLNQVDYKVSGDIQQRVHQSQLYSINELKNRLLDV